MLPIKRVMIIKRYPRYAKEKLVIRKYNIINIEIINPIVQELLEPVHRRRGIRKNSRPSHEYLTAFCFDDKE
jgi:hypothetical protein